MPASYQYSDAYLAPLVTFAREEAATTLVGQLGTFPAYWVERLTILQAYLIVCTECMKQPDDTFGAKLSAYRKEFDATLSRAKAAQDAVDEAAGTGSGGSLFSIELHRA